jgi:hypothetical protein
MKYGHKARLDERRVIHPLLEFCCYADVKSMPKLNSQCQSSTLAQSLDCLTETFAHLLKLLREARDLVAG